MSTDPTKFHQLPPQKKKEIADYLDQQADLLAYCWKIANDKLKGTAFEEESVRCFASTLYISAQRKFGL